jgi:lipid-A-disaccharide synthase
MKFVLVAGEASGDTLGEDLILALKQKFPDSEFVGIGGPKMINAGLVSWFDMDTLSVMGLMQVLPKLPKLISLYNALIKKIMQFSPDAYIGIDAPDFNLRVEKKIKASSSVLSKPIKIIHYVSPSIWAWRYDRIYDLKAFTDLMLCILPFEQAIYAKVNHPAVFVGHPLANKIPMHIDPVHARQALNLPLNIPLMAILPGSRSQEVSRLLPIFLEAFSEVKKEFKKNSKDLMGVLPVASPQLWKIIRPFEEKIKSLGIFCLKGRAGEALASADIALVASGTATLEAMLYKKPTVVAYKTDWVTYGISRALIHVPYIALPNLLAHWEYGLPRFMPEFIQDDATVENLKNALLAEWDDLKASQEQEILTKKSGVDPNFNLLEAFERIHRELALDSGKLAAEAIQKLLVGSSTL